MWQPDYVHNILNMATQGHIAQGCESSILCLNASTAHIDTEQSGIEIL